MACVTQASRHDAGILAFTADAAGRRISAGHDFAEYGQIRRHIKVGLRTA